MLQERQRSDSQAIGLVPLAMPHGANWGDLKGHPTVDNSLLSAMVCLLAYQQVDEVQIVPITPIAICNIIKG